MTKDAARPTLIELPDQLRSERLLIRPYRIDDAPEVFAAIMASKEHLAPWMPWASSYETLDDARDFCVRRSAEWMTRANLVVGLFDAQSGRYLGGSGLEPDWTTGVFEIGYWVRVDAVGGGVATEAARLLTDLAFDRLDAQRVELRCDAINGRSRRVAEKAGFVYEGTLRQNTRRPDGAPRDTLIFSQIRADRVGRLGLVGATDQSAT